MEDPDFSSSHHSSSEDEPDDDKGPSLKERKKGPPIPKNEGPVICDECGKTLKSRKVLNLHKKSQHNPNRSDCECPECLQKFKRGSSLWTHYCQNHMDTTCLPVDLQPLIGGKGGVKSGQSSSSTVCGICGKIFSQPGGLKRHYVKEHEEPGLRYPCPECGKNFKDKSWLHEHRKKAHGLEGKKRGTGEQEVEWRMCEECGEMVEWGKHLRENHMGGDQWRSWMEEKKMRMNEKRKLIRREARRKMREEGVGPEWLKREQRERMGGEGESSYKCEKEGCGKGLAGMEGLRRHLIEVHCELEEKIVKLKIIKLERKSGEFRCTLCGRRFGHRAEVRIHVVRDHPELHQSILEGTGMKRSCPMEGCGEEMEGEEEVRKHLEEMHGEDCFRCPECERVMLSPEEMEEHWEKMHGGEGGGDEGEGKVDGIWMWSSRKADVRSRMRGVIGEERMEQSRKWTALYSKYNVMRGTCEICGLGLNFQGYKIHLRIVHGVVEGEWRCEICEMKGKRYGTTGSITTREGWLTHMEWRHGDEVDMEGMVEWARKMNVEGGVEGLDKIHWKKWTNGKLVTQKKKKDSKEKKGGKGKRKIKRAIRKIKVKELKLSERLEEMGRELEREKRLVIGPLERVKDRKREILCLDVNS